MIRTILALTAALTLTIAIGQSPVSSTAFATVLASELDAAVVACELPWTDRGYDAACFQAWGDHQLVTTRISTVMNGYSDATPVNAWTIDESGFWARAYAIDDAEDPMFMHGFNVLVDTSLRDPNVMHVHVVSLGTYRTDTGEPVSP